MTAASTVGAPADRTPGAPTAHTIDIGTALHRLDRVWCRDNPAEPADRDRLGYYARSLEQMLDQRLVAAEAQLGEHPELERMRAENDTLRRQLAELLDLRRQLADAGAHIRQLERDATTWRTECDRLINARQVEHDNTRHQLNVTTNYVARLVLTATGSWDRAANLAAQVDAAETAIHEIKRTPRQHRHAWEWQPGLKRLPVPCSCGLPWPRDREPGGA